MSKARVFLGPAGVPLSAKGSTVDGIKKVAELKLQCMEVEFVRGVKMGNQLAAECGKVAEEVGVKLSVHAPYFINLCSAEKIKVKASKKRILDSVERAHVMHADVVVFHPGYYGKLSEHQAYEAVEEACRELVEYMESKGLTDVNLGLETTGKHTAFGTLEEIIKICKAVNGCVPVVDFAHMFARQGGSIDYAEVLDSVKRLKLKHMHTHFSGINFTDKGEKNHLPINSNKPPFEPLAKEILKRGLNITIISESPVLEQDSLKMKQIFERLGYKF